MTDLREMLEGLAETAPADDFRPEALLGAAKGRLRRRRTVLGAAAVAAVAVVVAGTAVVVGVTDGGADRGVGPVTPPHIPHAPLPNQPPTPLVLGGTAISADDAPDMSGLATVDTSAGGNGAWVFLPDGRAVVSRINDSKHWGFLDTEDGTIAWQPPAPAAYPATKYIGSESDGTQVFVSKVTKAKIQLVLDHGGRWTPSVISLAALGPKATTFAVPVMADDQVWMPTPVRTRTELGLTLWSHPVVGGAWQQQTAAGAVASYSVNDERLVTTERSLVTNARSVGRVGNGILRIRDLATGANAAYSAPQGCVFSAVYAGADTGAGLDCGRSGDQFLVLNPDGSVRLRVAMPAEVMAINDGANDNRLGSTTSDVFGVYLPGAGRVRFSGPPPVQPLMVVDADAGTVYHAPARTEVGSTSRGQILLDRKEGGGPPTQVVRLP